MKLATLSCLEHRAEIPAHTALHLLKLQTNGSTEAVNHQDWNNIYVQ